MSKSRNTPEPSSLSYDEMPYPGLTYGQTHPGRMAAMATLLGLRPAPVDRCRVLDVGCAVGGNLLPMAELLPDSQFVGIDYAARQIEIGRQYVAELQLTNVRLEHMDVTAVPDSLGHFDYIIAHGFYSWAPPAVRDQLLAVIRRHLAPDGVAFVSYNTYPGWYMIHAVRDAMLLRARHLSDPAERAAAGREIVEFLARALPDDGPVFGAFLNSYRTSLAMKLAESAEGGDSLLLHDEMAKVNDPVYFEQFVAHAESHGLQYLSEVNLADVMPSQMDPEAARELGALARNPMEAEQWMDFIRFRTFRQTLLVHQEAQIERRLRPQVVGRFQLASLAKAENDPPDLSPGVVESFKAADHATFSTDHPLTKAAFLEMIANRPRAIPFETLARAAAERIGLTIDQAATPEIATLAANALQALSYSYGLIEFHVHLPPMSIFPGERPRTTRVARWQAGMGMKATNQRHERIELDPILRVLVQLLDGQRDREQLLSYFMLLHEQGKFELSKRALETAAPEEVVRQQIEESLKFMGRTGMLIANPS